MGVSYEYSLPTALAPPPNQEYNWVHGEFSECNATCGGGKWFIGMHNMYKYVCVKALPNKKKITD